MNLHRKVEVKKKGVLWKPCVFMGCDFPRVLLKKKGGGADEYIRGLNIVDSFRNVSYRAACLYR